MFHVSPFLQCFQGFPLPCAFESHPWLRASPHLLVSHLAGLESMVFRSTLDHDSVLGQCRLLFCLPRMTAEESRITFPTTAPLESPPNLTHTKMPKSFDIDCLDELPVWHVVFSTRVCQGHKGQRMPEKPSNLQHCQGGEGQACAKKERKKTARRPAHLLMRRRAPTRHTF